MKKILITIFIVFSFAHFAMSADMVVKIDANKNINILNIEFSNERIGNCSVIYSNSKPYKRIFHCRICRQGQDPIIYGISEEMNFTAKQWTIVDNYIYKQAFILRA